MKKTLASLMIFSVVFFLMPFQVEAATTVDLFLWGGGGGGDAGGGGAGGSSGAFVTATGVIITSGVGYAITVGAGGAGGVDSGSAGVGGTGYQSGGSGSVDTKGSGGGGGGSSAAVFGTIYIASGGGGGGWATPTAASGSSGGNGGDGLNDASGSKMAGGGGGSGTTGGDASSYVGGAGGSGGSTQTGTNGTAGNKGGGSAAGASGNGANSSDYTGAPGSGGAGHGANGSGLNSGGGGNASTIGGNGENGGVPAGGGGMTDDNGTGGNGGNGRIVIRAALGDITATGGSHTADSSYDYWTFDSSGTWTPTTSVPNTVNRLAKFVTSTTVGDSLFSDDGSNITLTSGNLLTQIGSLIDTVISGVLSLGTVNATAITIGHAGITTTVAGSLSAGAATVDSLKTSSNCNSSASPAVCGSAPSGSVAMPNGGTTLVVNTTAITAASQILITEDSSLGSRLGVTCNTTTGRSYSVNARTVGTSFTIKSSNNINGQNKACLSYWIIN